MRTPPRRARPDWSQPLPEPIMLGRRKGHSLGDVGKFLLGLPDERATKAAWQHVARTAMEAAYGGDLKRLSTAIKFAQMTDLLN